MGRSRNSKGEFWYCNVCNAQNHILDGECQYCECEGLHCKRDNCSGEHPECQCGCGCGFSATMEDPYVSGVFVCDSCALYSVDEDGEIVCDTMTNGGKNCHVCKDPIRWGRIQTGRSPGAPSAGTA